MPILSIKTLHIQVPSHIFSGLSALSCNSPLLSLTEGEVNALMAVIDEKKWFGRRDKALIAVAL